MAGMRLVLLAALIAAAAAGCNQDSDCGAGEYCGCNSMSQVIPPPSDCVPFRNQGESCGGFTLCPNTCAPGLDCADRETMPWEPTIADMPGLCCPHQECTCAAGERHVYDAQRCPTCECKPEPCGGADFFHEGDYSPVTCETDAACAGDAFCDVLYNVCCPAHARPETTSAAAAAPPVESSTTTTTTASPASTTAPLLGGFVAVDPSDVAAQSAAACALQKINARSNSMYQQVLVELQAAERQVILGTRYRLTMAIAVTTDCNNDGTARTATDCTVDEESTAVYTTVVDIPPGGDFSVCSLVEHALVSSSTPSPQSTSTAPLLGGFVAVDPSDVAAQSAAACALQKINARSNSMYQQVLVELQAAERQVVAGTRYRLTMAIGATTDCNNDGTARTATDCTVEEESTAVYTTVVDIPPGGDFSVCSLVEHALVSSSTPLPQSTSTAPLLGGFVAVDPSDVAAQSAAACALQEINARSNSLYQQVLVELQAAERQVVAGTRYRLTMAIAATTDCNNDGTARTATDCTVDEESTAMYTTVVDIPPGGDFSVCSLVEHAVVPSPDTTSASSTGASTRPPLIGGWTDLDLAGEEEDVALAVQIANCAMDGVSADRGYKSPTPGKHRIISGRKQVVAGVKVELQMEAEWWQCESDFIARLDDQYSAYTVVVVLQPWAEKKCASVDYTWTGGAPAPEPVGCIGRPFTPPSSSSSGASVSAATSGAIGVCVLLVLVLLVVLAAVARRRQHDRVRLQVLAGDVVHPNPMFGQGGKKAGYALSEADADTDADVPPYTPEPTEPMSPGMLAFAEAPPHYRPVAVAPPSNGRVLHNPAYGSRASESDA